MAIYWKCNISSSLLVCTGTWVRQIKYVVIMTKEGSTKIVNVITIWAGVLKLRCGHISHYSEYALSSIRLICNTSISFVLTDCNVAFLCNCWCYLFYDGAVGMQIWALLTKSQCRVSDTLLVTINARGPLLSLSLKSLY